ncbi:MAG: sugar phosphate isomerase/epimerase family protein, partial [Verrucomicrobiales bacterium]|nr:sugar phosphate isomerase/epimerase family protein [Verrucomicrobiales bacterium]
AREGVEGIGICEFKLPPSRQDGAALRAFRDSGLSASLCVPATLSILPLPRMPGPKDPRERIAAMSAGLRRLAAFGPAACVCLTGPAGARLEAEARRLVVHGLREVARVAADLGLRLALEPVHPSIRQDWSLICTLPETLELLDEVGEPNLGVLFDTWHLGDAPDVLQAAQRHAARIFGVHINDRRNPTRSWKDRALPGEGTLNLPAILGALDAGGYHGWYDLEIFSDDGAFGDAYEDSLWKLPARELVRRGRAGFLRAWRQRRAPKPTRT